MGAYRPQRKAEVADVIGGFGVGEGYVHTLPDYAKRWMEGFLLEVYAVEAKRVRTGLHADRLKPEQVARLPRRWREHLGPQPWPLAMRNAAMKRLGLTEKDLDSSLRRSLYNAQNRANRDVFSRGNVVYAEEEGGEE